jgi:hypothetical protein
MDTRNAILLFMHAERVKSELLIASSVLADVSSMAARERAGAERVLIRFLEALVLEIRIAYGAEKSISFLGAEKRVLEAIGKIKLSEFAATHRCISESLSFVTTASQRAMEALEAKDLL